MGTTITLEADLVTVVITGDRPFEGCTYDELVDWYGVRDTVGDFPKRPGAPGAFAPTRTTPDQRLISIEGGKYFGPDRATSLEMRETLGLLYNEGRPVRMTVADDLRTTSREVFVVDVEIPWSIHPDFEFSIDVRSPDPRRYGEEVTSSGGLAIGGSGLLLPFDPANGLGLALPSNDAYNLGLDFGAAGDGGEIVVTNAGKVETASVMVVSGGALAQGFEIANRTTGQRLIWAGTVDEGDVITFDARRRTVSINAGDTSTSAFIAASSWWAVPALSSVRLQLVARGPVLSGSPRLDVYTAPAYY